MRAALRLALLAASALPLSACSGRQSALDPRGPQAESLSALMWIFIALCALIWLAVMVVLLVRILRSARPRPDPLALDAGAERRGLFVVAIAVLATGATVIVLSGLSFHYQRRLFAKENSDVLVTVTGHQWWWDVRYEGGTPDRTISTANEIYVPLGRPVRLKLAAADVIHSFWVPNLMGKQDLIPGQENELQFTATRPGIYRGQCAEFCGWQHAHMGLLVVAVTPDEFAAWSDAQRAPATPPDDPVRQRGAELFSTKACVMCHTIRGTLAGSRVGPDLTHFGSRKSIASATLPMSRGSIGAWITDPQGVKPGTNMPNVSLAPDEIDPLISYLAGLQ